MPSKIAQKRHLALIPPLLIAAIIFTFSSFGANGSNAQSGLIVGVITSILPSASNLDILTTIVRKSAHFLEYALLGFFTARAFAAYNKHPAWAIPASIAYAVTDELHQLFVPGRSCEITDILIDSVGVTLGAATYMAFRKR